MIINPGSGPVLGATESAAVKNIGKFMEDCGATKAERLPGEDDGRGRFGFRLSFQDGRSHTIEMPGWPLEQVRYLGNEGQDIWNFPRLYVDGSSWVWKYALKAVEPDVEGGVPPEVNAVGAGIES